MDLRTTITAWTGVGAASNARRSLDERTRAQDEVAALLARLEAQRVDLPASSGRSTSSAA
jgi:hypothetical protein